MDENGNAGSLRISGDSNYGENGDSLMDWVTD